MRWLGTIWKASPAAMCSFACSTISTNRSCGTSVTASPGGVGAVASTTGASRSAATACSTPSGGPEIDIVRRRWSNATTVSASMNRTVGSPASSGWASGSGTGSRVDTQS